MPSEAISKTGQAVLACSKHKPSEVANWWSRVEHTLAEVCYKSGYSSDIAKPQLLMHTETYV